ncbi:MAG: RluA family pseudouridine synthase [Aureliella sp.]
MPEPTPKIPIIAEDPFYWLINKPAGLLTQAAAGIDSVETQLRHQIKERDNHQGNPFVGLPHRLDRSTSGVMMVARNSRALSRFGQQFQSRKVNKFYLALLKGELAPGTARWTDSVRKVQDRPLAEIVESTEQGARTAELDIKVIGSSDGVSLALIQLHTGRMHQIRIQAMHRGHAVVGDSLYEHLFEHRASGVQEGDYPVSDRVALHALRLEFRHPKTALPTSATAPIPEYWSEWSAKLAEPTKRLYQQSSTDNQATWSLAEISA